MIIYSHDRWSYGFAFPAEAEITRDSPDTCVACIQHSPVLPQVNRGDIREVSFTLLSS